jgi:hypothetical protein
MSVYTVTSSEKQTRSKTMTTFKFEAGQVFNVKREAAGKTVFYPCEITKVTPKRVYYTFQNHKGYSDIKINETGDHQAVNYSKGLYLTQSDLVTPEPNQTTETSEPCTESQTTSEPTTEPQDSITEIIESIEFTDVLNDDYSDYYDFKVGDRVVLIKAPCNVASKIIKIENGVYHVSAYGATYQDNGLNLRILTKNSAYIYNVDFESNDDYSHYTEFKTGDRVLMSSWQIGVILGVEGGIYDIDVNGTIYQDDDCNITLFTENLAINCGIEYKPQYTPNAHDNLIAVDFTARKRV